MNAMSYEYLLRRIYHCGRHGAKGADADVYRKLEHAEMHLTNPNWNKTKEEKEYDYRVAFAGVKSYLVNALKEGFKQVQYKATEKEIEKLESIRTELNDIDFYHKKRLDEIIGEADKIFKGHGLEAR
jgi:hypothetical protein